MFSMSGKPSGMVGSDDCSGGASPALYEPTHHADILCLPSPEHSPPPNLRLMTDDAQEFETILQDAATFDLLTQQMFCHVCV